MDIEIWGFDHGVVHVLALPGSVMGLVGSLFLRFWDKVFVPSSRAFMLLKVTKGFTKTCGSPSSFINCNTSSILSAVYDLLCAVHFSTIL